MSSRSSYALAELAAEAQVSVSTVKYYLREGLLPPGEKRSATRADYDGEHLRRLRLLKVLREVGGVPVERLRGLVAALDAEGSPLEVLASGAAVLAPTTRAETDPAARELARELAAEQGWALDPDEALARELAHVLQIALTYDRDGPGDVLTLARAYAEVAHRLGAADIAAMDDADPRGLLSQMVVGQVVYGRLLDVMRRIAEQHHALRRWGDPRLTGEERLDPPPSAPS